MADGKTPQDLSKPAKRALAVALTSTSNALIPERGPAVKGSVENAVSQVFGIIETDLGVTTRGRKKTARARQVAMYVTHISSGMNLTDVGSLYGRDRTTVAHACASVEDRRDDPSFDRVMDLLEWIAREVIGRSGALQRRKRPRS